MKLREARETAGKLCHQGRGRCAPTAGYPEPTAEPGPDQGLEKQWEKANRGAAQGLSSLRRETGPGLGLTGDPREEPDLSKALKEAGTKQGAGGTAWQAEGSHLDYLRRVSVGQEVLREGRH